MEHQKTIETNSNETQYKRIEDMIDETKTTLINNIDILINRNETIETLVETSGDLQQNSIDFNNSTTMLKREMLKKRIKNIFLSIFGLLLVLFIILLIICDGFISNKCH